MTNKKVASAATVVIAALGGVGRYVQAAPMPQVLIPNHSFESPTVPDSPPFATSAIDDWQKEGAFGANASGIFFNTAAVPPQVDNAEGNQMGFLFAGGGTGLFQYLDGISDPNLTTAQTFTVGSSYGASMNVQGGGGMGASALEIRMFYKNGTTNVTVGTPGIFVNQNPATSSISHLLPVFTPSVVVQPGDPFANQPIGIEIVSIPQDGVTDSGYFDIDSVAIPEPASAGAFAVAAGVMGFRRVRRNVGERQA